MVQLNLNIQALSGTCQGLRNQQGILQYENNVLQGQYHNLSATNQYLLGENSRIQSSIQYLNSLGPSIINDIAGKEIQSILASNREILSLATSAVFLAVTQDPSKMYTINALSMMQFYNPFVQTDLEFYHNEFLDLTQRAYENLTLQCARKIVDSILQRKPIFGLETSGTIPKRLKFLETSLYSCCAECPYYSQSIWVKMAIYFPSLSASPFRNSPTIKNYWRKKKKHFASCTDSHCYSLPLLIFVIGQHIAGQGCLWLTSSLIWYSACIMFNVIKKVPKSGIYQSITYCN